MKRFLTIGQAAKHLGLAVDTVRRLEAKGELRALRTPGGHRRFSIEAVEAFRTKDDASPAAASRAAPGTYRPVAPSRRVPATIPPRSAAFGSTDLAEWGDVEDGEADDWDERSPLTPAIRHPLPPEPQARQVSDMDIMKRSAQDRQRLDGIKAHGALWIPYDVPTRWRTKVIEDLDQYVTTERFPDWVSDVEAQRLVFGRVEDVLKPHRWEVTEDAARAKRAQEEKHHVASLLQHGLSFVHQETLSGWDYAPAQEARRQVEEELRARVTSEWTERRVEKLVNKILEDWDDDEDEGDWDDEDADEDADD